MLLFRGLLFDAVGLGRREPRFHWAAAILSSAGTAFLLVAFICGIYAEIRAGRAGGRAAGPDRLARVPGQPRHRTVLSTDLARFDHVHPVPQANGSLQLDYRFPAAGQYLLFAEYMPPGERDQVFRFPLTVGDPAPPTGTEWLRPTPAAAEGVAGWPDRTAELVCQPLTLTAGTHALLLFRLSDRRQPVTDLEPYRRATGHCAIIFQGTGTFLHCRPEQLFPPCRRRPRRPRHRLPHRVPPPRPVPSVGPFPAGLERRRGRLRRPRRVVAAPAACRQLHPQRRLTRFVANAPARPKCGASTGRHNQPWRAVAALHF